MPARRFFLFVFMFVLCSGFCLATGITGGSLNARVKFTPGMSYEFRYILVADEYYDNNYTVNAKGDLSEYVSFDETRLENVLAKSSVPFSGVISPPDSLSPGWHRVDICVAEDCKGKATVCGRTRVCAVINLQVLYPGIMPVLNSFAGHNVNENDPVTFTAQFANLGLDDVQAATGEVEVFDMKQRPVGKAVFDSISIPSAAKGSISAVFDTLSLPPADYRAVGRFTADNYSLEGNTSFKIGSLDVVITDYMKEIESGGIKRFVVSAESRWNDPVPVFVDVTIYDKKDASFNKVSGRTATATLAPWSAAVMEAYLDTSSLSPGEYDLKLVLDFSGNKKSLDGKVRVVPGAAAGEKIVIREAPMSRTVIMMTVALVVLVILLAILNVFLIVRRKKG